MLYHMGKGLQGLTSKKLPSVANALALAVASFWPPLIEIENLIAVIFFVF